MDYKEAYEKLEQYGQLHVLRYFEELTEAEQRELLMQIEDLDLNVLSLCEKKREQGFVSAEEKDITPMEAMQLAEIKKKEAYYRERGLEAIRAGKLGAVLLAGGMGTRLGSDGPKGVFDIGVTKPVFIFERLFANLMEVVKEAGRYVHLFVMTSERNHEETVRFLREHQFFGYSEEHLHFFRQEMAPACDYDGRIYLEEKGRLASSPNGNGGWFSSLAKNRLLNVIHRQGIEWLNVFAVDNVLQRIADPCFIGAVLAEGYASGAKVIRKNAPDERVGVMCLNHGRPSIVEYYDLSPEMMEAKDAAGEPAYQFGVILNYLFREADLEEIMGKRLPLHLVEKKITYLSEDGVQIKPDEPNGYKFETLVLDMIELLDNCLPYEVVREREFAPIKNRVGVDSVDTARQLLRQNGIEL